MSARKHDLGKDGIWSLVLSLALPTALAQAVNVLYAIVDRMYIGHIAGYGDIALAGIGVAAPITTFISSFATLIGMGGAPIMAMKEGHGEHKTAERIVTTGFYLLLIATAVLTPLFFIFRNPILMAFGASSITLPYASEYLGWYLLGTPFALLATGLNNFVINQGQSTKGMISVLVGAAMNIILDPIFIFVFNMGVKGAAIATVISQLGSMLIAIMALCGKNTAIRLRFHGFMPSMIKRIIKLGLSSFIIISTDRIVVTTYTVIMFTFTLFGSGLFARLFSSDEMIISLSAKYMFIFESMIIPLSFQYINVDLMTALGQVHISLPLSLTRKFSFMIASIVLPMLFGAESAFFSEPISDILSCTIGTIIVYRSLTPILEKREKEGLSF